jgi:hypothetical protein
MGLRRPASADESRHEQAEGTANAKPNREELQDIRTTEPLKVRVIETVQERRKTHRQDEERGKLCPLFARAYIGFHDERAYHSKGCFTIVAGERPMQYLTP